MLVSGVQQSNSVIYIFFFFIFFSIVVYYRVLNIVPCAISCFFFSQLFFYKRKGLTKVSCSKHGHSWDFPVGPVVKTELPLQGVWI